MNSKGSNKQQILKLLMYDRVNLTITPSIQSERKPEERRKAKGQKI